MKKKSRKRKVHDDVVVPPITVGFEEAVTRLLRVKPAPKTQPKRKAR